jgi:hypothetical protein
VEDGHLSMLACCTTDTYEGVWTDKAIGIGLPNRLFVVNADRKPKVAWPERPSDTPLNELARRINRQIAGAPDRLGITDDACTEWGRWHRQLPPSEHARRLDTLGFRLMALMAVSMDKDVIDCEVIEAVIAILDYELTVRTLRDPIDADGSIAKLEERIRRNLTKLGPLDKRSLRQKTHADRDGLWAFGKALDNLVLHSDIRFNRDTNRYELVHPRAA